MCSRVTPFMHMDYWTVCRFVKLPAYTTLEVLEERLQYSVANSAGLIDMS